MFPDQTYREFLLTMVDSATEAAIEEGILNGTVDPEHLSQIEDELIDDFLFDRLSNEEKLRFRTHFLSSAERVGRFDFAAALMNYSARQAPAAVQKPFPAWWRRLAALPWEFPLAGALAWALVAAAWLAYSNATMRRELALSVRRNAEDQRIITSLRGKQGPPEAPHGSASALTSGNSPGQTPSPSGGMPPSSATRLSGVGLSVLRLSSEVRRGLAPVPVLSLTQGTHLVAIEIALPFDLSGSVREELLDTAGQSVWIQQFSATGPAALRDIETVILPAAILAPGEYRLRIGAEAATAGSHSATPGPQATYLFRIHRN
jgi:hypothetical protein